jgi:[acyl-carrier-protein] S-malonyltransferase
MGRAFYETSAAAKRVFEEAAEALGRDFTRLIFEGPEADLALTANTQPAVLTASVAVAAACGERGLAPALVAGHSLGEYSALVVAGALRLGDAVRIVRRRGELMQEAVPVGTGAMAALMGMKPDVVEGICGDAAQGEVVGIANLNSEMQIVIAGHRTAVERAVALAKERGGRKSVLLPVSAPFHCALMARPASALRPPSPRSRSRIPRFPSSATSTPASPGPRPTWCRSCSARWPARCSGRRVSSGSPPRARTRSWKSGPAAC